VAVPPSRSGRFLITPPAVDDRAPFRFVSAFTGIGGFDVGLELAGFECVAQIENDPFCNRVLAWRWPHVRRFGDITTVRGDAIRRPDEPPIDLLCGGFPCQDLSVAGRRAGLDGARSGLFFEFVRLARELRPRWLLVENVPGLFSSGTCEACAALGRSVPGHDHTGEDLAVVIDELGDAGYFVEWRVLDSRWFGVPQRRRRVFLVGHLGGPPRQSVLFESAGSARNPQTRSASWAIAAGELARSVGGVGGGQDFGANKGTLVAGTLGSPKGGRRSTDLDGHGAYITTEAVTSKWRKGTGGPSGDETQNLVTYGIRSDATREGIAKTPSADAEGNVRLRDPGGMPIYEGMSPTLEHGAKHMVFVGAMARDRGGVPRTDSTPALTQDGDRGDNTPLVLSVSGNEHSISRDLSPALDTDGDQGSGPVVFRKSKRAASDEDDETWVADTYANTLNTFDGGDARAVELVLAVRTAQTGANGIGVSSDAHTLDGAGTEAVLEEGIRRLTPTECERLQGFPDGWTAPDGPGLYIPRWAFRVKPNRHDRRRGVARMCLAARGRRARALLGWRHIGGTADGPRYATLGNAVTVPVVAWIGGQLGAATV
jgi:site-specific DNA-cytosine methylase